MRCIPVLIRSACCRGFAIGVLVAGLGAVVDTAAGQAPGGDLSVSSAEPSLSFRGAVRLRYEGIEGQYRASRRIARSDHLAFTRSELWAALNLDSVQLVAEAMDSREWFGGVESALDTGSVGTLDLIQGYLQWQDEGRRHRIRVGRQTMRLGSERLVARHIYRNTVPSFTGVNYRWGSGGADALEAFWVLPVRRRPGDVEALADGDLELDDQSVRRQFYGLRWQRRLDEDGPELELYAYGLTELGGGTRNRRLLTPGLRVRKAPASERLDFEVELAGQFGDSRVAVGGADLDHRAWLVHASIGYTADMEWSPRVRLAFDAASGDRDPTDGSNERFDGLFGAQRFDFGPTGIFGPVARENLISPELRISVRPTESVRSFVAARALWVAAAKDALARGGVRDPSGASGHAMGHQLEAAIGWAAVPNQLDVELGGAYLVADGILDRAPNARGDDVAYVYCQTRWTF